MILFLFTTTAFAVSRKPSFHHYSSMEFKKVEPRLNVPFPLNLSSARIIQKEARRLVHFLKRAFVGINAHYSSGRTYSNYGPVVGVQFPSRTGLRLWGGMNQGRTMDLKKDYAMDSKVSGINGHRVGVGVKLGGDLSLDLEYQTIDGEQSVQNNSYIMSLSVPMNL